MEYYLAIKRNKVLTRATTCTNLENITFNERGQTRKATRRLIPFIRNIQRAKSNETESGLVLARGWGQGQTRDDCSVGKGYLFGVMQIHQNYIVVRAEKSSEYTKALELHAFKWWILWAVNYVLIFLKKEMCHIRGFCARVNSCVFGWSRSGLASRNYQFLIVWPWTSALVTHL